MNRDLEGVDPLTPPEPEIRPDYLDLIHSDRVGERTQQVLGNRAERPVVDQNFLDEAGWTALRAVVARVIPQSGPARLNLAARIVADLDEGGDGWRFTDLPPDSVALPAGLRTLDTMTAAETGRIFAALGDADQDDALGRAAAGTLGSAREPRPGQLSAAQMKLWFQDLCSMAVRLYVAHPATLARMGYSGIANGGDRHFQGFAQVGRAETEAWEPASGSESTR